MIDLLLLLLSSYLIGTVSPLITMFALFDCCWDLLNSLNLTFFICLKYYHWIDPDLLRFSSFFVTLI